MMARPLVMGSSVVIMRISVDGPAPFGPSNPKISPCFTANETSSTAVKSPYFLVMWSTTMASPLAGASHPALLVDLEWNQLIWLLSPDLSVATPRRSCLAPEHRLGYRPSASDRWS